MAPERTPWQRLALLRPGQEVEIINVSPGGALIASPSRMAPGMRTELQLFGPRRCAMRGYIARCRVACLAPLRYEGAIVFEERLEFDRDLDRF